MSTVYRALKEMAAEQRVKIGADGGSCFFYCGTAGEFLSNIEKFSHDCYMDAVLKNRESLAAMRDTIRKAPTLESWALNEVNEKKPVLTSEQYLGAVDAWLRGVQAKSTTWHNMADKLEKFQPISERDVVYVSDCDPVADEAGIKILVMTGFENGEYWTFHEAQDNSQLALK